MKNLLSISSLILILTACDAVTVLTTTNIKSKTVDPQYVIDFCDKRGFKGIPLLTFGQANVREYIMLPQFALYDKSGRNISFDDTVKSCRDPNYYYLQARELFKHHIDPVYQDSFSIKSIMAGDTSIIYFDSHLDNYSKFLVDIYGNKIEIDTIYKEYLLLYPFYMFGERKIMTALMKDFKSDVDKLNDEFGDKIQLVLVSNDFLSWMKGPG